MRDPVSALVEFNGLDYFLTTDKKFTNVMTLTKLTGLNSSKPVTPRDLLENLGIGELDPLPIGDWKIRPFVGTELVIDR